MLLYWTLRIYFGCGPGQAVFLDDDKIEKGEFAGGHLHFYECVFALETFDVHQDEAVVLVGVGDGTMTATEVKGQLRAEGLKGRELTRRVNEVLTGKKDIAWAKYEASVSILRSNGFIPDYVDARKTGASARFVRPSSVSETVKPDEALEVIAKEKGMTVDELKALLGM